MSMNATPTPEVQAPLADCTNQALQSANQAHSRGLKPSVNIAGARPTPLQPKVRSHNPYVGVIPNSVPEMMRVLESRRQQKEQQQTAMMRRTFSTPSMFTPYGATKQQQSNNESVPQSPLTDIGAHSMVEFPRAHTTTNSPTMFFDEPEMVKFPAAGNNNSNPLRARTTSPTMMNVAEMSFGSYNESFGGSTTGNSPVMAHVSSPMVPAPASQQQKSAKKKNNNRKNSPRPSDRRQPLIEPTSTTSSPATPTTPAPAQRASDASSPVNSSTESNSVMTKVYQNGRPVPRMVEDKSKVVCEKGENAIVLCQFRHHQGNLRAYDLHLLIGQHVIVDGDRGVDMAKIISVAPKPTTATEDLTPKELEVQGNIQRTATEEEVEKYEAMKADDEKALEVARSLAQKHLNTKLDIVNVNFQYDRQKLTLWYKAIERVYFVPLLKALNQEYKCRIWMERIEDEATAAAEAAAAALEKKNVVAVSEAEKKDEKTE